MNLHGVSKYRDFFHKLGIIATFKYQHDTISPRNCLTNFKPLCVCRIKCRWLISKCLPFGYNFTRRPSCSAPSNFSLPEVLFYQLDHHGEWIYTVEVFPLYRIDTCVSSSLCPTQQCPLWPKAHANPKSPLLACPTAGTCPAALVRSARSPSSPTGPLLVLGKYSASI